jgi:rhamnulokinase
VEEKKTAAFLGFDLGAESGRAVLGTIAAGRLGVKELHRFPNLPLRLSGHMFWDVYGLLKEMTAAMNKCAREERVRPTALGVSTWGVDFGLLARDGSLLGLPYCYRDKRNQGAMEDYFKLVPPRALYEATGTQFMPFNSLFQVYAMVRERSPLLEAATDLLFMPDLLNFLLTGVKAAEFTIASTSQMLDPRTRVWQAGLFQAMGFSRRLLRDVIEPGTVLGPLELETGLGRLPVVAVAGHDTASAVAAVPASGRNWLYISSGTWSLVGVEEPRPVITDETFERNFTNEGGVGGTIRLLKNVTGLWLLQECRRAWSGPGELSYEKLAAEAAEAEPFRAFIDPDHPVFLNPPNMPAAIERFCLATGQKPPDTPAGTTRLILESLALKYRLVIDELRSIVRRPLDVIHVIGGGSRNALLCRFTADAAGMPVVAGPAEATAVGNIVAQARAFGLLDSWEQARALVRDSFEPQPFDPRDQGLWERQLQRFGEVVAAGAKFRSNG